MPADENTRLRIRQRFIDLMDEELADAIMESMPPIPWSDLATKDDIAQLETRFDAVDARFDAVDARFDAVDARFDAVDARFDAVDACFDVLNERFVGWDQRFEALHAGLHQEMVGLDGRLSMRFMEATRMIVFAVIVMMTGVLGVAIAVITQS